MIELMMVILIAGLLMAYGIPAYNDFSQRQYMSKETNNLIGDLNYARNLAINNSTTVSINALSANWQDGWTVSETLPDGSLQTRRIQQTVANTVTMVESGGFDSIEYNSFGAVATTSQPLSFNIGSQSHTNFISLRVLASGIISSNRSL